MKYFLVITAFVAFFLSFKSSGQSIERLDEKKGFRAYKLNTDILLYPELQYVREVLDDKMYVHKNENLDLGIGKAKEINYNTYNGKIISINIITNDIPFKEMFDLYKSLYGNPTATNIIGDKKLLVCAWQTNKVRLTLRQQSDNLNISYYSLELHNLWKNNQIKNVDKAKKDF